MSIQARLAEAREWRARRLDPAWVAVVVIFAALAAVVHAPGQVEALQDPLVDPIDQQVTQVGVHLDALQHQHTILIPVALQVESRRIGAMLSQDKAVKGMDLAVGQDELNIAFDGRRTVVRSSSMHMHIENHNVPFFFGKQTALSSQLTES